MIKLDLKDRKILYQLDLNARQSNAQIGKKVGLHRNKVLYRINRMIDEGVIKNFWIEFNTFKLGYNCYRLYLNFQDVSLDVKNEIIQYFVNCKNAWAVMSAQGPIDFDVMLWVKDSHEFNQFWNKTLDKYGMYFANHIVSVLTGGVAFKKSYLLSDEYEKSDREYFILRSGGKTIEIDELDYQLLNEMAVSARIPLIDLAEKLGCSSQTTNYRMKNLIRNGIILAIRVNIDMKKLGFQNSALDIYLKDHTQRNHIINYVKHIPYVEYLIEAVGWADITLDLIVKNTEHLTQIMDDIDSKFPGAIRKQNFWMSKKYHRLRSLPELF